jgi:hypothetical protein
MTQEEGTMKKKNFGLPGNPVVDTAIVGAGELPVGEGQFYATMALAAEQRTANLIAAATATYADGSAMFPFLMGVDGDGLVDEIKERLGF